jgi:hypothetical protein
METAFSDEFKKRFLLAFTKELIIHSKKKELMALQEIVKEPDLNKIVESRETNEEKAVIIKPDSVEEIPQVSDEEKISVVPIKPIIQHFEEPQKQIQKPAPKPVLPQRPVQKPAQRQRMERLYIPETRMPSNLEYLKPTYIENKTTSDWEKLNPLIKDNAVRMIEVIPDEKVRVSGSMGERTTNIILNAEEVNEIINKFAYVSRIPVSEGVYKVVVENLIFFAVISGVVGSRFIIQKVQPAPAPISYPY